METKNNFSQDELTYFIEISKSVIQELEHFYNNFTINEYNLEDFPIGMDDLNADMYVHTKNAQTTVQSEMEMLAEEPFVGWVKALNKNKTVIFLLCRNYTPIDFSSQNEDVLFVNKISPVGADVSKTKISSFFEYDGVKYKVISRNRSFKPIRYPKVDGVFNTIDLASGVYSIESLRYFLEVYEEDIAKQIPRILEELIAKAEITKGVKRRIIESIKLRDQPILDSDQITTYRVPIQTNLIVTGAPGTGKTTVLINRISLATKPQNLAESEIKGLSNYAISQLKSNPSNWVLYTPTELLKMYLQQAFNKENIPAYDRTIKVWHSERMEIGKNVLRFLKIKDKGIFIRTEKPLLLEANNAILIQHVSAFIEFINFTLFEKFNKTCEELLKFAPDHILCTFFNDVKKLYETRNDDNRQDVIFSLIDRLSNSRSNYNIIKKEYDEELEKLYDELVKVDDKLIEKVKQILQEKTINITELPEDEDEELETDVVNIDTDNINIKAYQEVKRAIALHSERVYQKMTVSKRHNLSPIIETFNVLLESRSDIVNSLGKKRLIVKLTNQLTGGITRNLIQIIPTLFQRYRSQLLKEQNTIYDASLRQDILNRKITDDEIDILIYIMLMNAHKYFTKYQSELRGSASSEILQNIKSHYKNIITVDEATDFSTIALGCMLFSSNPLIRSVTLTGDPMQRITQVGIKDWEDCNFITKKWEENRLLKVYRQSPKLLKIAWELYNKYIGKPPFSSAFEINERDPDPLKYNSTDKDSLGNWITNRILEIYEITNGKASIAIFVSDDSEINSYYEIIYEKLADNNIEVDKCLEGRILGADTKVRIFSVEYIKGLEFESVFFVDMNSIYKKQPELIDKYLYVGLTRAGSFLGVTYEDSFPEPLQFINDIFKESDWSSLIL